MMIAEAVAPENQLAADETESTVKAEAINSTGNILAGAAAGYLKDLAGGARSGSIKGVEAGTKLGTQALVLLGLKEVAELAGFLPEQFGWIKPAIAAIRAKLGL
jgi:hypothetical protein